jgi:hypothetical protein
MTREEFTTVCSKPLEATYGPMDRFAIEMYYSICREYPREILAAAILKLISELKWLPKPSEIRAEAANIMYGQWSPLSASEAWGLVHKYLRRIDFELPHTVEKAQKELPPLVWEAAQNAGLSDLVYGKGSQPMKWFQDAYNAVLSREGKRRLCPPEVNAVIERQQKAIGHRAAAQIGVIRE